MAAAPTAADFATLLQQFAAVQTQRIALQGAAARQETPEVAKPDEFDGRSDQLEQFIHQCTLFLAVGPYTDRNKITTVLSYMKKGSALAWAEQKLDEYSTGNPTGQLAIAAWAITWANFLVELRAAFGDVAREKLARIRIHDIKQTKTVDAYNVAFNAEQSHTGFNEEALLDIWKKGLKPSILRRIYNEATAPANFAAWHTCASHYDHVDQELSAAFPPKINRHPPQSTNLDTSVPHFPPNRPPLPPKRQLQRPLPLPPPLSKSSKSVLKLQSLPLESLEVFVVFAKARITTPTLVHNG
jgi:hypothetical protein